MTNSGDNILKKNYLLFGERCSGTSIIESAIALNSPLIPTLDLGSKHFPKPITEIDKGILKNTPALIVVRDPYEWIRSLYVQPWHAAPEVRARPFSSFVKSEWWSIWDEEALISRGDCKYGEEILEDRDPITGHRFADPFQLRKSKYARFLKLAELGESLHLIRLEDYVANPTECLASLLGKLGFTIPKQIDVPKGYKGKCSWKRRCIDWIGLGKLFSPLNRKAKPEILPPVLADINSRLDMELEIGFGYKIL
jgi:hypothetical protein